MMKTAVLCFGVVLLHLAEGVPLRVQNALDYLRPNANAHFQVSKHGTKVTYCLYTTSNPQDCYEILDSNVTGSLENSNFNAKKMTLILIHGYMEDASGMNEIRDNILERDNVNVITVDWRDRSKTIWYPAAAADTIKIGTRVSQVLEEMVNMGVRPKKIHIIGYSLGAHVAGITGKKMKNNDKTVGRITGLDPTLPGFSDVNLRYRLDSGDANFVDCIYTAAGFWGYDRPICQANFYPNHGINVQPGCCWFDFGHCSHTRSYSYFLESILPTHKFVASKCQQIPNDSSAKCGKPEVLMGYYASPSHKGIFSLKTNSKYPYAKSVDL